MAAAARQASTGRSAGWVVRLDAAPCSAARLGSADHRIGTGASRMSDPFAADSWSITSSVTAPVRVKRSSARRVVEPMSKQWPVDDQ